MKKKYLERNHRTRTRGRANLHADQTDHFPNADEGAECRNPGKSARTAQDWQERQGSEAGEGFPSALFWINSDG